MSIALLFALVATTTNALVWHKEDDTTVHCEDITVADQNSSWCKNNCWRYENWSHGKCPSRFNYVNNINHPADGVQIREVGVFAQDCDTSKYLGPQHVKVPCTNVPPCTYGNSAIVHIKLQSDGHSIFDAPTQVQLCYDKASLNVRYMAKNDTIIRNDYTECNTDMWNQEVMEIFIADSVQDPTHYHEVEINPNNALYVAEIDNPYMNGTDKSNTMVPCQASGIKHNVQVVREDHAWNASLSIPWSLVSATDIDIAPKPGSVFRYNLFRVRMTTNVSVCAPDTCEYGAWSPTLASPPQYHITPYMGLLVVQG